MNVLPLRCKAFAVLGIDIDILLMDKPSLLMQLLL